MAASQAWLSLAAGDLPAVQRWQYARSQQSDSVLLMLQEHEELIVARMLIAQGEPEEALRLLENLRSDSHTQGRTRSELEITLLQALAHHAIDDLPGAKQTLIEALRLAQPEGYLRLFLDEGQAMATLLEAVLPDVRDEPLGMYVRSLLLAFAQGRSGSRQTPPLPSVSASLTLIEPLSPQEQRVLRLLVAGHSNPEIARELVVSVNTIRSQVRSIYRKLNVSGRAEARQAARQLNLL
jgi:LuxR family maltose regulon positive regulatory protein